MPARGATAEATEPPASGVVVEFDDVERRAVRALAEGGLIPPLRHSRADDDSAGAAV
jgi:hypothetical protein